MFSNFVIEVPAIYAHNYFTHQSSKLFKHRQKKPKKPKNKRIKQNKKTNYRKQTTQNKTNKDVLYSTHFFY